MQRFLDELLWERLPGAVGKVSSIGAGVLQDGQWTRSRSWLPPWLPVILILAGAIIGATHPPLLGFPERWFEARSFSSSFAFTIGVLILGCFSARYALFVIIGFIVGDVIFFNHPSLTHASHPAAPLPFYIGLLVSYNLLLILACITPVLSRNLAVFGTQPLEPYPRTALASRMLLAGAYQYLFLYSWVALFPFLIRPLYTFAHPWDGLTYAAGMMGSAVVLAIRNTNDLVSFAHPIMLAGVAAILIRLWLERREEEHQNNRSPPGKRLHSVQTSIAAKTAYGTLLFLGFAGSWAELALLSAMLAGFFVLSSVLRVRFSRWYDSIEYIPLLPRILIGAAASFLIADRLLPGLIGGIPINTSLMIVFFSGLVGGLVMLLLIRPSGPVEPGSADQTEIRAANA